MAKAKREIWYEPYNGDEEDPSPEVDPTDWVVVNTNNVGPDIEDKDGWRLRMDINRLCDILQDQYRWPYLGPRYSGSDSDADYHILLGKGYQGVLAGIRMVF